MAVLSPPIYHIENLFALTVQPQAWDMQMFLYVEKHLPEDTLKACL